MKLKPWDDKRPTNYYSDCTDRPRPCPWVGCKHHLLLDVNSETGSIVLNVGRTVIPNPNGARSLVENRRVHSIPAKKLGKSVRDAQDRLLRTATTKLFDEFDSILGGSGRMTCVLDCVEGEHTYTLEEVGDLFGVTRERVRQIESKAKSNLKDRGRESEHREWAEMKE